MLAIFTLPILSLFKEILLPYILSRGEVQSTSTSMIGLGM